MDNCSIFRGDLKMLSEDETLINIKKETKDRFKQMCKHYCLTYDGMLNYLMEVDKL